MMPENSMSIDQLRAEVRRCWDAQEALFFALRDLPEVPALPALSLFTYSSSSLDMKRIGKCLQMKFGHQAVPFKSEYEYAAGLWSVIREAIIRFEPQKISTDPAGDPTHDSQGND